MDLIDGPKLLNLIQGVQTKSAAAVEARPADPAVALGCPKCGSSGYKGRLGIHELMTINEELIDGINKEIESAELKNIAIRHGMNTLHQDSMLKVKEGLTTMEEAIATVPLDL